MMSDQQTLPVRFGHDFLRSLYHMIHAARIYRDNNQLVGKSVHSFQSILNDITVAGDIGLVLWRGRFHIGGERLPYRRDGAGVVSAMVEFFSRRRIGGIRFLQASRNASSEDILLFARLFTGALQERDPSGWLDRKLREVGLAWVQVSPKLEDDQAEEGASQEEKLYEKARNTYFHAVETVTDVARKASKGMVGVRKARRLAQNIVDLIREDKALMIGLATIKDYDDYTYTHSVNVSLLATCLGRHIGLSDVSLEYLSVCGLLHDLGKIGVSKEVLLKQGALSESEWEQMRAHPLIGVRQILMLNAPEALRSRIILGPFEHHLNPDMTGYPRTVFMDRLSLLGKILRIADVYEALTAQRAYRPHSYTPDEALRKMWQEAGIHFDRILLKRFIDMMGIFPVGSVVELSDGRIALVMDYPDESERSMPLVMCLVDQGGGELGRGEDIYLAGQAMKASTERLNIVRGLSPEGLGINPAQYFLHEK
jgi:HD-GYP domain-containing protein (c-di-GMP phosphodiesterase class II)